MLIPSIDLQNGQIVQLVQGDRLAIASDDIDGWISRFERFPTVQVIDLDAAKRVGTNDGLVRQICQRLPCRIGGGIRTRAHAAALVAAGAEAVIVGSALFRDGAPDVEFARALAEDLGIEQIVGAVDSRGGRVVTHGWQATEAVTAVDAVGALESCCGAFLYTHVETEGLMGSIDVAAVMEVRRATSRKLSAAGGISTRTEIDRLDAAGVDAVVGMAIYSGVLDIE